MKAHYSFYVIFVFIFLPHFCLYLLAPHQVLKNIFLRLHPALAPTFLYYLILLAQLTYFSSLWSFSFSHALSVCRGSVP